MKSFLLRAFGAKIGKGVIIKPRVRIKYPWFLEIGNYSWLGESVWIDNLGKVVIGKNVCLSQGALLISGNHDYNDEKFSLIVKDIKIMDGAWICAKSIVAPGLKCKQGSILTLGSVAKSDLDENGIYSGNPAKLIGYRNK